MTNAQPKPQAPKRAISPTRGEDYAQWYQQVVKASDMAEMSGVRGCMVIKPWGYGAWELMQQDLDQRLKKTGHDNCYFPLFIPLSYFQKEAEHVEGFAKEMAVVTHHRLAMKDGKLVPDAELEEPLIVRPTSETVIGEAMSKWIKSYRDLPLLLNQWANVVRWEMRPRILLRTSEFLWQEGHTAHETHQEAMAETLLIHGIYREFVEQALAVPIIPGEKPANERFPGAVNSFSIEAMMQDGRALQAGTSHYLGRNFSESIGIQFQSREGNLEHVHTTSWGVSTRLLGALVMTHADDDGMRMPPRVAPQQIIIMPILRSDGDPKVVLDYCEKLRTALQAQSYAGQSVRVRVDKRDISGAEKKWEWIKKGVPLLLEIGPRDVEGGKVCVIRRDRMAEGKRFIDQNEFVKTVAVELEAIQKGMFDEALAFQRARTVTLATFDEIKEYFSKDADTSYAGGQGFVRAHYDNSAEIIMKPLLEKLDDIGVTIRCLFSDPDGKKGPCIFTGQMTKTIAIFARAY